MSSAATLREEKLGHHNSSSLHVAVRFTRNYAQSGLLRVAQSQVHQEEGSGSNFPNQEREDPKEDRHL